MKYVSILFFLIISFCLFAFETEEIYSVGAYYLRKNSSYNGYPNENYILPYVKIIKSFYHFEGLNGKAHVFNRENFQTGFELEFGLNGHQEEKSEFFEGLGNRNHFVLGGIYHIHKIKGIYLSMELLSAIYGPIGAMVIKGKLSRPFKFIKEIVLTPFAELHLYSADFIHYYYGIDEDNIFFEPYQGVATINTIVGTKFEYDISTRLHLMNKIAFTLYGAGIRGSPINSSRGIIDWSFAMYFDL